MADSPMRCAQIGQRGAPSAAAFASPRLPPPPSSRPSPLPPLQGGQEPQPQPAGQEPEPHPGAEQEQEPQPCVRRRRRRPPAVIASGLCGLLCPCVAPRPRAPRPCLRAATAPRLETPVRPRPACLLRLRACAARPRLSGCGLRPACLGGSCRERSTTHRFGRPILHAALTMGCGAAGSAAPFRDDPQAPPPRRCWDQHPRARRQAASSWLCHPLLFALPPCPPARPPAAFPLFCRRHPRLALPPPRLALSLPLWRARPRRRRRLRVAGESLLGGGCPPACRWCVWQAKKLGRRAAAYDGLSRDLPSLL